MNTLTDDGPAPIELPEIVWVMGHPTISDPEMRGTRIRRCLVCDARQDFNLSCGRGMIVHLIDPDDIHAAPARFDGMPWAEPDAIAGAHAHWRDKGFLVTRKPGHVLDESEHPRFAPCPVCNGEAMRTGRLPVNLPTGPPSPRGRGERGRDATRP